MQADKVSKPIIRGYIQVKRKTWWVIRYTEILSNG